MCCIQLFFYLTLDYSRCAAADFPVRVIRYQNKDKSKPPNLLYLVEWADTWMTAAEYLVFKEDPHDVVDRRGGNVLVRWTSCQWILDKSLLAPVDAYPRWVRFMTPHGEERRIGTGLPVLWAKDDFPA